jgi:hypothetical protein
MSHSVAAQSNSQGSSQRCQTTSAIPVQSHNSVVTENQTTGAVRAAFVAAYHFAYKVSLSYS